MAFIEYNPNPRGINTGDCVIRAICKALDMEWEKVYMDLTVRGLQDAMCGCESVSVRNTSTQAIDVQNANITFDYIGVRRVV